MGKTALLLVNIGTPDAPKVSAVRRYLSQFLNDARVIDIPWILRKIVVNLIIVPFRAPKSTKLYQKLWTKEGSPLVIYGKNIQDKLQDKLGDTFTVVSCMRYGNPSLKNALKRVQEQQFEKVIILPLFPQYASSTTGSVIQFVSETIQKWTVIPEIKFINQFYNHPAFIKAFVKRAQDYNIEQYDHIIFSYHGLPLRQIDKTHPEQSNTTCTCTTEMTVHGQFCYKATCYETTRLLTKALNIPKEKQSVSFQSRLSNNWLEPFTDALLLDKVKKGNTKILVFAPAFVADCLETIIEIGYEYEEMFKQAGGEQLTLVSSLNDMDEWVDAICEFVV